MSAPQSFNHGLSDPRTNISFTDMISLFYGQVSASAAIEYFSQVMTGSFTPRYFGRSSDIAGTLWFRYGTGENLILSQGTEGLTHIPNLLEGWRNHSQDAGHRGISGAFWKAANFLMGQIKQVCGDGESFLLAGHSYGGSQLQALALLIKEFLPNSYVRGCSYGSSRVGNQAFSEASENIPWLRWYNDTDPVPRTPPRSDEAPVIHFGLPSIMSQGMNSQMHAGQGMRIFDNGTVEQSDVTTISLVANQVSIASWLLGGDAYGAQSHRLAEYRRRFSLMPINVPFVGPSTAQGRSRDDMPVNYSVSRIREQALDAVRARFISQPVLPATTAPQVLPYERRGRYRVKRFQGEFLVVLDGYAYGMTDARKDARRLARAWNRQGPAVAQPPPVNPGEARLEFTDE